MMAKADEAGDLFISYQPNGPGSIFNNLIQTETQKPLSRASIIKRIDSGFRTTQGNIAAIDFGTTFCTLAYTTTGDPEVNTLKLDGVHQRVPNAVLIKRQGDVCQVVDFGYRAQETYSKMRSDDRVNHIYFERMKMILKRDEALDRQSVVEAFNGEKFYIVEVIAFILKYLKERLESHLSKTVNAVKATEFDWVITVPAIWNARGKRMMREAAYLAGLTSPVTGISTFNKIGRGLPRPEETNPDKLSLALEPESAAIYSQTVTMKLLKASKAQKTSKYMVVDIGGGTVDITAHHEEGGKIEVVVTPMGNDWGGTKVNEEFSKLLSEIVDDVNFAQFLSVGDTKKQIAHKAILNNLLYNEFEQQKMVFGESVGSVEDTRSGKEICISLPSAFILHYTEDRIRAGAEKFPGVQYDDDALYIRYDAVVEIFEPALEGITRCTLAALNDVGGIIDTVYLVGGFGGSKYVHSKLTNSINKRFVGHKYRIVVPTSANLAIASGAVMWRKNPTIVSARKADATYGICLFLPFEDHHDPFYKVFNDDNLLYYSRDAYKVFLQKGEMARIDEVITTEVVPLKQSQTDIEIYIYTTPDVGVKYIKDKQDRFTVRQIGRLVIDIPNPGNLTTQQRLVDVTMDFSGTEIQAKAKYRITGEEVKTVCDFLSSCKDS